MRLNVSETLSRRTPGVRRARETVHSDRAAVPCVCEDSPRVDRLHPTGGRHVRASVRYAQIGLAAGALVALAACSPPSSNGGGSTSSGSPASATSAAAMGGMDALVTAAKKEGTLNVIALPAGLGQLRRDHQRLQGQVRDHGQLGEPERLQPGRGQRGQVSRRAPTAPPTSSTSAWPSRSPTPTCSRRTRSRPGPTSRPARRSRPDCWFQDYGGYMSIGYDSAKVPDDHLGPGPAQARVQGQGRAER